MSDRTRMGEGRAAELEKQNLHQSEDVRARIEESIRGQAEIERLHAINESSQPYPEIDEEHHFRDNS